MRTAKILRNALLLVSIVTIIGGTDVMLTSMNGMPESQIGDYWVIEYDMEYFDLSYIPGFLEYTEFDRLRVNLIVMVPDTFNNYRLNFNGEILDLTGYENYSIAFEVSHIGERVAHYDTVYREAAITIQQWNETKFNYFSLGSAGILRAEGNQEDKYINPGFEFLSLLILVSLVIVVRKSKKR